MHNGAQAIRCYEVEVVPECGQAGRVTAIWTCSDVSGDRGAGLGAVGAPEFSTGSAVVGSEVEEATEYGEVVGVAVKTGVDIFDECGAQFGAVGAPELSAGGAVVGLEVEVVTEYGGVVEVAAVYTYVDVGDARGASLGAVGAPELSAGGAVGGRGGQPGRRRPHHVGAQHGGPVHAAAVGDEGGVGRAARHQHVDGDAAAV